MWTQKSVCRFFLTSSPPPGTLFGLVLTSYFQNSQSWCLNSHFKMKFFQSESFILIIMYIGLACATLTKIMPFANRKNLLWMRAGNHLIDQTEENTLLATRSVQFDDLDAKYSSNINIWNSFLDELVESRFELFTSTCQDRPLSQLEKLKQSTLQECEEMIIQKKLNQNYGEELTYQVSRLHGYVSNLTPPYSKILPSILFSKERLTELNNDIDDYITSINTQVCYCCINN